MQKWFSSSGNDPLYGQELQEVDTSSEVSLCLLVLSFYLADMKLEKQGLWFLTPFSFATNIYVAVVTALSSVRCCL